MDIQTIKDVSLAILGPGFAGVTLKWLYDWRKLKIVAKEQESAAAIQHTAAEVRAMDARDAIIVKQQERLSADSEKAWNAQQALLKRALRETGKAVERAEAAERDHAAAAQYVMELETMIRDRDELIQEQAAKIHRLGG